MLTTTLNEIRKHNPCESGWGTLTEALGPDWGADEPIPLLRIIETNGIADAVWALRACPGNERISRLFACACAREVWHLLTDDRSRKAVEVAERYAVGKATDAELLEASSAAWDAARDASAAARAAWAARAAAWAAARAAAWAAARDAGDAAWAAADTAALDKKKEILINLLEEK